MTDEKTKQEAQNTYTEKQENEKLLRLKTGSAVVGNVAVNVLHITSPNMSSDSSVNWSSQHSQHIPS
jgi:hypothetical protein